MLAFLTISIAMTSSVGAGENVHRWDLLRGYDPNPDEFKEYEIGNKIVYWHQRKIGEAIIEHIAYHFDKKSRKLTDIKVKWRDELPATLPRLALTKKQAESMVRGKVSYSQLWVISPDSVVFPIKPATKNPCWVVTSIDANDGMQKTVIDAVEGKIVGYGIVPPYAGFAMSGQSSCGPSWLEWSENARNWFETMGYPTEKIDYPQLSKRDIIEQVRSSDIAMFYEVAHGGESSIDPTCIPVGRVNRIFAYDVAEWIQECSVMPFTFLASCDGMCFTGQGTFAYEFTKGYADNTAAVGYCGMSTESCSGECWSDSIDWQSALFGYMSEGYTVKDAFDLANADFPDCYNNQCMRFAGDPDFSAVPVIARDRAQNLTRGGVYASIQDAIDNAQNYDVIRVFRGHHRENIVINGKVLSIQSVDANDREVVSETIIEGDSALPVVTFSNVSTGQGLVLRGFTIRGGSCGVECTAGASVEISKCIISNNEGAGINCTGTGQAILANNIIYDNAAGITLSQSQARATMRNNTITDNTSLGISYSGNPQFSPFISNCILWNNNNDIEGCQASYSCIGEANAIGEPGITHNVCTDPLFIDTAGHNYRLKITSPCIDRGDTTLADANETDIDGDPRVRNPRLDGNAVVDIGADEVWKWVLNVTRQTYYPGIAEAISDAQDADRIMLGPGVHKSPEKNIADAGITLMSMDPDNWEVVENTVVDGFIGIESSSTLSGLRITATHGSCGVYLLGNYNFKINRCIIEDFRQ
jgi:parallel beta-helix repeat protein